MCSSCPVGSLQRHMYVLGSVAEQDDALPRTVRQCPVTTDVQAEVRRYSSRGAALCGGVQKGMSPSLNKRSQALWYYTFYPLLLSANTSLSLTPSALNETFHSSHTFTSLPRHSQRHSATSLSTFTSSLHLHAAAYSASLNKQKHQAQSPATALRVHSPQPAQSHRAHRLLDPLSSVGSFSMFDLP